MAFRGFNPVLTPLLRANETYALLEQQTRRSGLLRRAGERESLQLALAARESSVVVEGMRLLAVEREKELGVQR